MPLVWCWIFTKRTGLYNNAKGKSPCTTCETQVPSKSSLFDWSDQQRGWFRLLAGECQDHYIHHALVRKAHCSTSLMVKGKKTWTLSGLSWASSKAPFCLVPDVSSDWRCYTIPSSGLSDSNSNAKSTLAHLQDYHLGLSEFKSTHVKPHVSSCSPLKVPYLEANSPWTTSSSDLKLPRDYQAHGLSRNERILLFLGKKNDRAWPFRRAATKRSAWNRLNLYHLHRIRHIHHIHPVHYIWHICHIPHMPHIRHIHLICHIHHEPENYQSGQAGGDINGQNKRITNSPVQNMHPITTHYANIV